MGAGMGAAAEFLSHLEVERRMSVHTLDAYRRDLDALTAWANDHDARIDVLDGEQLRQFIAAEHRRGLSPTSLQRRLSACRSFYAWLLKHRRIEASPAAGLKAPKAPRKLPQVLDADEAVQLVELPTDGPLGLRDRALLELFYSSGLRLSELCALIWRDLDFATGLVNVLGKGNRERRVPFGSHARTALEGWRGESGGSDAQPCSRAARAGRSASGPSRSASASWPSARACSSMCTRTCCGTVLPATSWNPPATCAACRNCSGMPISPPRRSTPTWISSTWPRSTTPRTRARSGARAATKAESIHCVTGPQGRVG